MPVTTASSAPYAPSSVVVDFVNRYRNRGMATPITAEVLSRASVSGSLIPRTIQALQILDLIGEEGNPTETLENLRRSPEPEFKNAMAAWIRGAYADVFKFIEPTDGESAVRDAFRAYNPVGQQPRMISLFLGLCRAAGLRPNDSVSEAKPKLGSLRKSPVTPRKSAADPQRGGTPSPVPAPIAGLLNSLPPSGEWTTDQRAKFLKTFEAVLDFCYSINDQPAEEDADA